MNRPLKVGIIGTGFIATTAHIPGLLELGDRVEIVAVADFRPDALEHAMKQFGIQKGYTDYNKMLEENEFDLVHVCTTNGAHKECSIAALRAGANVLCEKPLALNLKDANEMFAEADKAGKMLIACQNSRFGPIQEIKKIYERGDLGEVYYTEIECLRRRGVPPWGRFHVGAENGGGPLCDVGVHYLDAVLFALGNPKMVNVSANTFCKIANQEPAIDDMWGSIRGEHPYLPRNDYDYKDFSVEDFASGIARFENGMQMMLKFSWALNFHTCDGYRFLGTKAGLEYRKGGGFENPIIMFGEGGGFHTDTECVIPIAKKGAMPDIGHRMLIKHMADVLQNGEECLIKRPEMLNVVAVMEAFYLSGKLNREVTMQELENC